MVIQVEEPSCRENIQDSTVSSIVGKGGRSKWRRKALLNLLSEVRVRKKKLMKVEKDNQKIKH